MAKQSLLWTALPNGYTRDGKSLRVSILLSPRLDAEADPLDPGTLEKLATFPDFIDWPHTLAQTKFIIRFGAQSVTIAGNERSAANRVDGRLGTADSTVWAALFPDTTFVGGYKYRDLSSHRVLSFEASKLNDTIRGLYSTLAASAKDQLPTPQTFLNNQKWTDLLDAVAMNDHSYTNRDTGKDPRDSRAGVRDVSKQFRDFKKSEFKQSSDLARDLARFQLFHTPPAMPKIDKHLQPPDPAADAARREARWLGYERAKLPKPSDFEHQIDFHQIVSAMNQYPTLLRLLGLVVDLIIAKKVFTDSANAPLSVLVQLPPGAATVVRVPDVSQRTRTLLDKTRFEANTRPALGLGNYVISNGLLNLNPSLFKLLQADVDGAGIKVMNFARTLLLQRNAPDQQRDPVSGHERETGAPALRNAGLMLAHGFRAEMLKNTFDRQKQFNDIAKDIQGGSPKAGPLLSAEDLLRGFRIDIWDDKTREWHSLCRRDAGYDINSGEVTIEVPDEEGTVRLAATTAIDPKSNKDTEDIVWLHETLVSWIGWSLCAPPPGKTITHDPSDHTDSVTGGDAEVPPGLRLKTRFTAVRNSLPRLRYGRSYWIRARAVDLAGNSLALARRDFGPENSKDNAIPYLRYEPISPPAIALVKPAPDTVDAPEGGESMERMAVRTFNDKESANTVKTSQRAHRFAVPARTTQREAEQHGMLDAAGKVDPGFFAMLAAKDNSLMKETILMSTPLSDVPAAETGFAAMAEGEALPYLPDPLTVRISARIFGHPAFPSDKIIEIPFYDPGTSWPDARPFKIELFEDEDSTAKAHFDKAARVLFVPLPKAERATLRLSVMPSKEALGLLGVWNWLTAAQQTAAVPVVLNGKPATLERLALNGQHWMLTPWRNIELVHAVQKPLITPAISNLSPMRGFADTFARISFITKCSIKSTNHLDLLAQWNEPAEHIKQNSAGENRARTDHAFAVKITDDKSYAGDHEYELLGPDVIRAGSVFNDRISKKIHEFNDTRYRRVEYWLDATTKFREFMPASVLTDANTGEPTDENIKVTGEKVRTWIPSSAPPPAPEVLYVVPTFGWVRSFDRPDKTSWRRGGGLRVYLNRPWNVSGYGEMLAVVLPSAGFKDDPNTQPQGQPLKNFITQWGNDPIWLSSFVAGASPKRSNFPLARTAADPAGKWLPPFGPMEEVDQPPEPFQTTGLHHPELSSPSIQARVEIAPHDAFYDEQRQLWYCDIEVNWGTAYYPFIRLALARYQPVSIFGAHLSNIVLADFMPLVPDRWLNVTQTLEPRTRNVSVFGFTYDDSSAHKEAKNAKGVEVAHSSVVEVWVERLEQSMSEDFGWRRDPQAFVQRGVSMLDPRISAAGTRVTRTKQISRAKELLREREFSALIDEKLIDKILVTPTLWQGNVTLPENPSHSGTRYRLVIAEYEEYLVDDAKPYKPPPMRKDRRLVFVEHVELT